MEPAPASATGGCSVVTLLQVPELVLELVLLLVEPPAPELEVELEVLLAVEPPVPEVEEEEEVVDEEDVVDEVEPPVPPLELELHAPIVAPAAHPKTAPAISHAFFMIASEFLVAAT